MLCCVPCTVHRVPHRQRADSDLTVVYSLALTLWVTRLLLTCLMRVSQVPMRLCSVAGQSIRLDAYNVTVASDHVEKPTVVAVG
jgi:hypothetical protein